MGCDRGRAAGEALRRPSCVHERSADVSREPPPQFDETVLRHDRRSRLDQGAERGAHVLRCGRWLANRYRRGRAEAVGDAEDGDQVGAPGVSRGPPSTSWPQQVPFSLPGVRKPEARRFDPSDHRLRSRGVERVGDAVTPPERRARIDVKPRGGLPHGEAVGQAPGVCRQELELLEVRGRAAGQVAERAPAGHAPEPLPTAEASPAVSAGRTASGTGETASKTRRLDLSEDRPEVGGGSLHELDEIVPGRAAPCRVGISTAFAYRDPVREGGTPGGVGGEPKNGGIEGGGRGLGRAGGPR